MEWGAGLFLRPLFCGFCVIALSANASSESMIR